MQGGELSACSSPIESATIESAGDQCSWKYQVSIFEKLDAVMLIHRYMKVIDKASPGCSRVKAPFQARVYH